MPTFPIQKTLYIILFGMATTRRQQYMSLMPTKKSLYGVRIYELKNVIFMMPNHRGNQSSFSKCRYFHGFFSAWTESDVELWYFQSPCLHAAATVNVKESVVPYLIKGPYNSVYFFPLVIYQPAWCDFMDRILQIYKLVWLGEQLQWVTLPQTMKKPRTSTVPGPPGILSMKKAFKSH